MGHKSKCIVIAAVVVGVAITVVCVSIAKYTSDRLAYKKNFLVPFHEIYDSICQKYPFITSLHEKSSNDGTYGMYYIECDFAKNIDCFSELVDVQREINSLMKARKDDEWFNGFEGHIEVFADCQSLRVFYHNGSMCGEIWANDIITDNYNVLWNAFPEKKISLVIFLADFTDEIKTRITQQYYGRSIIVRPQIGG